MGVRCTYVQSCWYDQMGRDRDREHFWKLTWKRLDFPNHVRQSLASSIKSLTQSESVKTRLPSDTAEKMLSQRGAKAISAGESKAICLVSLAFPRESSRATTKRLMRNCKFGLDISKAWNDLFRCPDVKTKSLLPASRSLSLEYGGRFSFIFLHKVH